MAIPELQSLGRDIRGLLLGPRLCKYLQLLQSREVRGQSKDTYV
jgi:hypothetical protein